MSVFCQQQGGAAYGKVFHDINQNGIYEPHLGESGFHSSSQPLLLELVDCDVTSLSCDRYNYSLPWYQTLRTFPVSIPELDEEDVTARHCPDAGNGGCFSFECPDCWGTYKIRLSREMRPEEYGWNTSPVKRGDFREGWTVLSVDPNVTDVLSNNFESFESVCFRMYSDMNSLESYEVVMDMGIYLDSDMNITASTPVTQIRRESEGEQRIRIDEETTTTMSNIQTSMPTQAPNLIFNNVPVQRPQTIREENLLIRSEILREPTLISQHILSTSPSHIPITRAPTKMQQNNEQTKHSQQETNTKRRSPRSRSSLWNAYSRFHSQRHETTKKNEGVYPRKHKNKKRQRRKYLLY